MVALPKNDTPTNGHHASTNDDPSRAAAEWMEATKGDLVFNSLIQKSLEGSGSNSLYLDTMLKSSLNKFIRGLWHNKKAKIEVQQWQSYLFKRKVKHKIIY